MRVGTLCFANDRGLGHLGKSYYEAGVITDFAVLHHGRMPTHPEWYPGCIEIGQRPYLNEELKEMILQMDVMLFFETPFEWEILNFCRDNNIRTVIMTMYECMPTTIPVQPDRWWCPSLIDQQYFPDNSDLVQVPVENITWKERTVAKTFIHNAGHIGLKGRNGTEDLLRAMQYVQSPIELEIRCQTDEIYQLIRKVPNIIEDERVEIFVGTKDRESLWRDGDVAICPEHWNGLSLPLQEAYASGLLIMTTNRFPMNTWLPNEPMIKVANTRKNRVANRCVEFDESLFDPVDIADRIDHWYGKCITSYSIQGGAWGEVNNWERLKSEYIELLGELL